MLTIDQALAHLEGKANQWRLAAADSRRNGDEYKAAANDADDATLRRVQFDESSRFYGYAREIDRDVEALEMVLRVATSFRQTVTPSCAAHIVEMRKPNG